MVIRLAKIGKGFSSLISILSRSAPFFCPMYADVTCTILIPPRIAFIRPGSLACPSDNNWETYSDWLDMNKTRTQIEKYSKQEPAKPFFLAFGAHRPHLPWNIPRHFWDLYKTDAIALPLHESAPIGMPPIAFTYECDGMTEMKCLGETAPIPYPNASTALPYVVLLNQNKYAFLYTCFFF